MEMVQMVEIYPREDINMTTVFGATIPIEWDTDNTL